jgi:hypothetical protein
LDNQDIYGKQRSTQKEVVNHGSDMFGNRQLNHLKGRRGGFPEMPEREEHSRQGEGYMQRQEMGSCLTHSRT